MKPYNPKEERKDDLIFWFIEGSLLVATSLLSVFVAWWISLIGINMMIIVGTMLHRSQMEKVKDDWKWLNSKSRTKRRRIARNRRDKI